MKNEDLLTKFSDMTYSEQQLFIQNLRRLRASATPNNTVRVRKARRKVFDDVSSLLTSLTQEQIAVLLTKLEG